MSLDAWIIAAKIALTGFFIYRIERFIRIHRTVEFSILLLVAIILLTAAVVEIHTSFAPNQWLSPALISFLILIALEPEIVSSLSRWSRKLSGRAAVKKEMLSEVVRAVMQLAETRTGALIAFERNDRLLKLGQSGVAIDAEVKKDLLLAIFVKETPTHDGCVLIRNGRISHCGVVLPLTGRTDVEEGLGTRHRAAIGLSEKTDAVCLVVSEEEGTISIAKGGTLIRRINPAELGKTLQKLITLKSEKHYYPLHYLKGLSVKTYTHSTIEFGKSYGQFVYELLVTLFFLLAYIFWNPAGFKKSMDLFLQAPWMYSPFVLFALNLLVTLTHKEIALDNVSGTGRKRWRLVFLPLWQEALVLKDIKHVLLKQEGTNRNLWTLWLNGKNDRPILIDRGSAAQAIAASAHKIRELLRVELIS